MLTFTSCHINIKNARLETASSVSRGSSESIAKFYCGKRPTVREGPDLSIGGSSLSDIKLPKGISELANIMVTFYVLFFVFFFCYIDLEIKLLVIPFTSSYIKF